MKNKCTLCPRGCTLDAGQTGACLARKGDGEGIVCANYGVITSMALDPIEKKPLKRFHEGGRILSVGSYGCNLSCPFCQNHEISAEISPGMTHRVRPEELAEYAASLPGNLGLAYTYNEPLVGYEFVRDCAGFVHEQGLFNVLVTNGYLSPEPFDALAGLIDAMNIDLKAFSERFYAMCGGDLKTVKRNIAAAAGRCHLEVTTLIIPGENDSIDEINRLAFWLASVDPKIPLHITRFFPRYRMTDRAATPVYTIKKLANEARRSLYYVYEGNI